MRVIVWSGVRVEIHRTRACKCGVLVDLGFSERDRVPVVMHHEPVCQGFRERSADNFILWNDWIPN